MLLIFRKYSCTCLAVCYTDNIGGSSPPWLVLEYLPNGDLKSFLMVLVTVLFVESYVVIIVFCLGRVTVEWQISQVKLSSIFVMRASLSTVAILDIKQSSNVLSIYYILYTLSY